MKRINITAIILFAAACTSCSYDDVPETGDGTVYYEDGDGSCEVAVPSGKYCVNNITLDRKIEGACVENYECISNHCLNRTCLKADN